MATDFLGQTLNIGDDVIFLNYNRTSADLKRGKITKIFPHAAGIGMKRRAEYKIVKILTDVAPVVHGQWVDAGRGIKACSNCNHGIKEHMACANHYCPNCGAKMDGGDNTGNVERPASCESALRGMQHQPID